ncbi:endochitinase A [Xenopus tropicalis]|uniref:Endochitinase A n=1 Tax=Xenopus tropicalis TaxID=8364 RepID=A0A8J1J4H7_XENTR|nr:endochitinase A [Xenopus tropicalis]
MKDNSCKLHLLPVGILLWILHSAMVPKVLSADTTTELSSSPEVSPMSSTGPTQKSADPSQTPPVTAESPSTTYNETAVPTMLNENDTSDPMAGSQFSCQTFHCMENDCYKNKNSWTEVSEVCTHDSYCEIYRHSSSHYEARCSHQCTPGGCIKDGAEMDNCTMFCCNTSMCLTPEHVYSAGSSGMSTTSVQTGTVMPPTTAAETTIASIITTATTATPATTATTIAYSGLKCRSFKCTGLNCFTKEVNTTTKYCRVGISHCELQKVLGSGGTISYEGGCSDTCATSKSSCASIQNANCFQECCNATKTGCCMILDGQVHFNTAMHISRGSIWKLFSLALIVIFTPRFFSFI